MNRLIKNSQNQVKKRLWKVLAGIKWKGQEKASKGISPVDDMLVGNALISKGEGKGFEVKPSGFYSSRKLLLNGKS